ncbi:MAG: hypothetical protein WA432_04515 [Candidatus Babeliaceae bacterium]
MYFVTAADTQFFKSVVNVIALIQHYHGDAIKKIAVFDLGFTPDERAFLNSLVKVTVYDVEMVHPDLLTLFVVRSNGKIARGWYAWKPVIIKQALDMFPSIIYMDAGVTLTGPLDKIFEHIERIGYFFISADSSLRPHIVRRVKEFFDLDDPQKTYILDQGGIAAGFQGVSQQIYKEYVLPLYELAHHLEYFVDDGSAHLGFGNGRHDQTIASIYVNILGYQIHKINQNALHYLHSAAGLYPFYLGDYVSFWQYINLESHKKYLRFKPFVTKKISHGKTIKKKIKRRVKKK